MQRVGYLGEPFEDELAIPSMSKRNGESISTIARYRNHHQTFLGTERIGVPKT